LWRLFFLFNLYIYIYTYIYWRGLGPVLQEHDLAKYMSAREEAQGTTTLSTLAFPQIYTYIYIWRELGLFTAISRKSHVNARRGARHDDTFYFCFSTCNNFFPFGGVGSYFLQEHDLANHMSAREEARGLTTHSTFMWSAMKYTFHDGANVS